MSESDQVISELPLDSPGDRLRRAREAAGLSLADIAARTRIAERHLKSIESGNFIALASRAYAVGFSRSFAREVGLDEDELALAVRHDFDGLEPANGRYQPASFEPGDPARVPAARIAWIAGLSALAVVIAGLIFWRSFYAPAGDLPDVAPEATASAAPASPAILAPTQQGQGPVVFTALAPGVWVKFYDAAGNQLLQRELALGETYTVPADANGPMIRTARPEALQVTIGGQIVAKLGERQMTISDVPVSAAALLARGQAPVVQATSAAPVPTQRAQTSAPARAPSAAATRAARRDPPRTAASSAPRPEASAAPVPVAAPTAPAVSPQSSTVSQ